MDCFCLKTHHFMLNDDTIKVNIWDNNKIENNNEILLDISCCLYGKKIFSFAAKKYIREYCSSQLFIDDLNGFILFRTPYVKEVYPKLNIHENLSWRVNEQLPDIWEYDNKFVISILVQCCFNDDETYSMKSVCSFMAACIALHMKNLTIPVEYANFFKITNTDLIIDALDFSYFQK